MLHRFQANYKTVLRPSGSWFALLSPERGKIDQGATAIGEHREAIARKNIKAFIGASGLQYHSPHKFRHGHIHYGNSQAKGIEDFKAVSLNVMHSSMKITDQFYSNLTESEIENRIRNLGKNGLQPARGNLQEMFEEFMAWREAKEKGKQKESSD